MEILSKELAKLIYSSSIKGRNSAEPSFCYLNWNPEGDNETLLNDSSVYVGAIGVWANQESGEKFLYPMINS